MEDRWDGAPYIVNRNIKELLNLYDVLEILFTIPQNTI